MSTTLSAVPLFSQPPATPIQGWSNSFINIQNDQGVSLYANAIYPTNVRADGSNPTIFSKQAKDVVNRAKVVTHQNVYEADFEYGSQPLRWENYTTGSATIIQVPQSGGVQMKINNIGDYTVRQSRPYHRYQPGKTMFMATACNFGGANAGQTQRVGFFDDSNGIFFEQGTPNTTPISTSYPASVQAFGSAQANPWGMAVVVRNDINGIPTDTRIDFTQWNDPFGIKNFINWNNIAMLWMEYAWYGAGALRWGVFINGEAYVLHEFGTGNTIVAPWARTGNLPVRYEQRNYFSTQPSTFYHYGVSVIVEGGRDAQRGFTYSYGLSAPVNINTNNVFRKPLLSLRGRTMGQRTVDTYTGITNTGSITGFNTSWAGASAIQSVSTPLGFGGPVVYNFAPGTWPTVSSLSGLSIYFPTLTGAGYPNGVVGRIYGNNSSSLTAVDVVAGLSAYGVGSSSGIIVPALSGITALSGYATGALNSTAYTYVTGASGIPYQIGLINRGQLLPQSLLLSTTNQALLEFFVSTPYNPVLLNTPNWRPMAALSAYNSFAEIDQSATAFNGGEIVYSFFVSPGAQVQEKDLSNFFPLYNTIRGNTPDILTLAITTYQAPVTAGANLIAQEAMS